MRNTLDAPMCEVEVPFTVSDVWVLLAVAMSERGAGATLEGKRILMAGARALGQ